MAEGSDGSGRETPTQAVQYHNSLRFVATNLKAKDTEGQATYIMCFSRERKPREASAIVKKWKRGLSQQRGGGRGSQSAIGSRGSCGSSMSLGSPSRSSIKGKLDRKKSLFSLVAPSFLSQRSLAHLDLRDSDAAKQLTEALRRSLSDEQVAQYVSKIESDIGVTVNQAAFAQVTGANN